MAKSGAKRSVVERGLEALNGAAAQATREKLAAIYEATAIEPVPEKPDKADKKSPATSRPASAAKARPSGKAGDAKAGSDDSKKSPATSRPGSAAKARPSGKAGDA